MERLAVGPGSIKSSYLIFAPDFAWSRHTTQVEIRLAEQPAWRLLLAQELRGYCSNAPQNFPSD